jgi:hypothetical protein
MADWRVYTKKEGVETYRAVESRERAEATAVENVLQPMPAGFPDEIWIVGPNGERIEDDAIKALALHQTP